MPTSKLSRHNQVDISSRISVRKLTAVATTINPLNAKTTSHRTRAIAKHVCIYGVPLADQYLTVPVPNPPKDSR